MKKLFTIVASIGMAFSLSAQLQIPNSSFETWTAGPASAPTSWATWETSLGAPLGLATRDTIAKVLGSASIKVKTDSVQAGPTKRLINGFAHFGSTTYNTGIVNFYPAAFNAKPDTLFFTYRYTGSGSDSAVLLLSAKPTSGASVAGSVSLAPTPPNTWVTIFVPLTGQLPATVDSFSLYFSSSKTAATAVAGSVLNVDAIRLGYRPSVGIEDFVRKIELNVFPNPATDFLQVNFKDVSSPLYFEMVDALGRIVMAEELTKEQSMVDVSKVEEGTYFYRISIQGVVVKSDGLVISR